MTKRQKQHQGRSASDDTTLEGRDIRADARPGTGNERVSGAFEEGAEASNAARHVEDLLEEAREPGPDDRENRSQS